MATNRVPFPVRVLSLAIAVALLYLLWWMHTDDPEHRLIFQIDLAFGGLASTAIIMAFWPRVETAWHSKAAILGMASFLTGAIWMSAVNPYSTMLTGFPWVLLSGMVFLSLTIIIAPNRHFVSARC